MKTHFGGGDNEVRRLLTECDVNQYELSCSFNLFWFKHDSFTDSKKCTKTLKRVFILPTDKSFTQFTMMKVIVMDMHRFC